MAAPWASLRASDRDRERIADRLKAAASEGRIVAEELEERLARTLRARTYGDLDAVVSDLPREGAEPYAADLRGRGRGRSGARGGRGASARSRARAVARQNPTAAVLVLVALTLAVFVVAALVLAGVFAFSGLWLVLGFVAFARGGRPMAGAHGGHRRGGGGRGRYRRF